MILAAFPGDNEEENHNLLNPEVLIFFLIFFSFFSFSFSQLCSIVFQTELLRLELLPQSQIIVLLVRSTEKRSPPPFFSFRFFSFLFFSVSLFLTTIFF